MNIMKFQDENKLFEEINSKIKINNSNQIKIFIKKKKRY